MQELMEPEAKGMPYNAAFSMEAIEAGALEVRLAKTAEEIENAKRLRYKVFVEELGANLPLQAGAGIDTDDFDAICDHLLVIDRSLPEGENRVVGTYRLLRTSVAALHQRYYSASEYNIAPILALPGEKLELGRSCVAANYRTRAAMQLLWRGIGAYVTRYDIALMFGCASFPGVEIATHKAHLAYLYHYHLAPEELRCRALDSRYQSMDLMAKEAIDSSAVQNTLPPLIKGYLRLGGFIGDGAVLDHECNTTDVFITVKTDLVTDRYVNRYGSPKTQDK